MRRHRRVHGATVDPGLAEHYHAGGYVVRELRIETRTLSDICAEHGGGSGIEFLKIDAEGHEREVLEGAELERWRPRVLVVEATVPHTREPSHLAWEHVVVDAGYVQAVFDEINRFYVRADECAMIPALRQSIGAADGQVIPRWLVRTMAQLVSLDSADDADGQSQATRRDVTELFTLAGKDPGAFAGAAWRSYRHVLTNLTRGASRPVSPVSV